MKTKDNISIFTDGTWELTNNNHTIITESSEGYRIICELANENDARLIAEAKNMYKALKEWLKVINRSDAAKFHYGKITEQTEEIINRIDKQ